MPPTTRGGTASIVSGCNLDPTLQPPCLGCVARNDRFLHIPPYYPTTKWRTDFGLPWWRDRELVVGKVTKIRLGQECLVIHRRVLVAF